MSGSISASTLGLGIFAACLFSEAEYYRLAHLAANGVGLVPAPALPHSCHELATIGIWALHPELRRQFGHCWRKTDRLLLALLILADVGILDHLEELFNHVLAALAFRLGLEVGADAMAQNRDGDLFDVVDGHAEAAVHRRHGRAVRLPNRPSS